jgi:hypothetical protein
MFTKEQVNSHLPHFRNAGEKIADADPAVSASSFYIVKTASWISATSRTAASGL